MRGMAVRVHGKWIEPYLDEPEKAYARWFPKKVRGSAVSQFQTTKARIAQVIYVVGGLASFAVLGFTAVVFVALLLELSEGWPLPYSLRNQFIRMFVPLFIILPMPYAIGWAIRWIMTGISTTVFSYLRRSTTQSEVLTAKIDRQ